MMDLQEVGWGVMEWIYLGLGQGQVVGACVVMNLWVP